MRLIDADELYKNLPDPTDVIEADFFGKVLDTIDTLPIVEAEPVRCGRWLEDKKKYDPYLTCSVCGLNLSKRDYMEQEWREVFNFCPCCGAKMEEKMIDYKKIQSVTFKQIDDMKHAIGFDDRRIKGTKYRKYEPYRNYFDAGERDIPDMEKLVEIGLMSKSREHWYHVNDDGKKFLQLVTGVEILADME